MARKPKPRLCQEEQSRRFIEAAQEAGVDVSDDTLERIVHTIAKAPKKNPPKYPATK